MTEGKYPLSTSVESAVEALKVLSKTVLEGRKPPSGAYAFFHHNAHAMTATQDCGRILTRLFAGRDRLTRFALDKERLRPKDWPAGVPYPEPVRSVMNESQRATEYMKLDLESLYMFGGILLDQWALQAIAIGNATSSKQYPFRELVDFLDSQNEGSILAPLWRETRSDMLWLYYQMRFYRNRFIVHANRPWQRGTTMGVYGDDFNLFTPTPPGWLDDTALDSEIRSLLPLTPERIRNARDDYWEKARPGRIIEVLFDNIAQYDKPTREKISRLFGRKGGSTPDFKVLGNRLLQTVCSGTEQIIAIASANLATIDLGPPHSTSVDVRNRHKQSTEDGE